ncbi:sodium:solute symporter family protein [Clostridium sp. CX1]|uniref:Sodium:solute symporter family protein n=1 Tax=Clostridium tanneri TaxID=3037988 RepID=A0ABU4JQ79_9CLOT|nr:MULTISPECIES: sodium:solute symporter family protein [unclassified Clostridium]MCT8978777.1 sodium:solute symporter family protein [Clostridium sp. CX1]MDW8800292.1 sodium:solute symporter family protein [Clostridium sp. A1-XYC3]
MNIYILGIALYCIALIIISVVVSKFVKSGSDFIVAGRRFNSGLLFATLIGGNIGAGSTVGITGLAYTSGISAVWWMIMSGIGSLVLAFFVGPKVWELSVKYNLLTAGDFLDKRYSKKFKGVFSTMMAIGTLALFAGQLMGVAWILNVIADVPKTTGVIIGALVVTIYFAFGGIVSAAYVGILKLVVVLAGFIIAVPFALGHVGGFSGLHTMVSANLADVAKTNSYFSFFGLGATVIIGYFFMLTPSFFVSPGLVGIVFGSKDKSTIRKGTTYNAIVQFVFAFIPAILGMCTFAMFPHLTQQDLALPTAMKELLPTWVSAIALAAVFAAEISTADTVLYMLTTSFTNDIYKTFFKPKTTDIELLKLSRYVTFICGVLGVGMSLLLPNIITALSIFYTLMSVSLTAPLLFGIFSNRPTAAAASVSAILGVAVTIILTFGIKVKLFGILNAQTTGMIVSLIIMAIMMYAFPAKAFKEGKKEIEMESMQ